jgi:hypothetical protein
MLNICRLSLLTVGILAFASPVVADDAALAAKLVGTWEGKWEFSGAGGKLTAKITASTGNSLKGETTWFGTAVGDFSDRFSSAKVKGNKLKVSEQTMDFEATISEDGSSMEGTWTSPVATGGMNLKKKVN